MVTVAAKPVAAPTVPLPLIETAPPQWVYHPGAVTVAPAVVDVVGDALAAAILAFMFGGMGGLLWSAPAGGIHFRRLYSS